MTYTHKYRTSADPKEVDNVPEWLDNQLREALNTSIAIAHYCRGEELDNTQLVILDEESIKALPVGLFCSDGKMFEVEVTISYTIRQLKVTL